MGGRTSSHRTPITKHASQARYSYYVEFRVLDNGKTLTLAQKGCGQLKRWKVRSGNRTVAKQHEAMIQTELMKGLVISDQARPISDWKRLNVYGHTKNVNMPLPFSLSHFLAARLLQKSQLKMWKLTRGNFTVGLPIDSTRQFLLLHAYAETALV